MTNTDLTAEPPEGEPAEGERPAADALAERLEGGPPPRDDPPEGERADPHLPPLDRLEDYVNLRRDDPRRVEAARLLGGDEGDEAD